MDRGLPASQAACTVGLEQTLYTWRMTFSSHNLQHDTTHGATITVANAANVAFKMCAKGLHSERICQMWVRSEHVHAFLNCLCGFAITVLAIECMTGLDKGLVIDKHFTGNGGCHMGV